jgi:hypothetical protein
VKTQSKEIEALKAEIHMLSRKSWTKMLWR